MTARLGVTQKKIVDFIGECGPTGAYIGSGTTNHRFRGMDLEQVEDSLRRLQFRGLIRKEGIRWLLTEV